MATDVQVLDDGTLQIICDGKVLPPLPIEAIQAAADRIPDAQHAANRQTLTAAVRTLTDVLLAQGDDMQATVTVDATSLSAVVDAGSYRAAQARLDVQPDGDGVLDWGPVSITQLPEPDPEPDRSQIRNRSRNRNRNLRPNLQLDGTAAPASTRRATLPPSRCRNPLVRRPTETDDVDVSTVQPTLP